MRVRQLRPGDWVVTSHSDFRPDPHEWQSQPVEGLLLAVVRRPGNNDGPIAWLLTSRGALLELKASHILHRRPVDAA